MSVLMSLSLVAIALSIFSSVMSRSEARLDIAPDRASYSVAPWSINASIRSFSSVSRSST